MTANAMSQYETRWFYLKRKRADARVAAKAKSQRVRRAPVVKRPKVPVPSAGEHGLYEGCKYTKRVIQLQHALNVALETRLKLDGVYGKYTKMVIALLQRRANLPYTGRYDAATEKALRRFLEV